MLFHLKKNLPTHLFVPYKLRKQLIYFLPKLHFTGFHSILITITTNYTTIMQLTGYTLIKIETNFNTQKCIYSVPTESVSI